MNQTTNAMWSKIISTLLDDKRDQKGSMCHIEADGNRFGYVSMKSKRRWEFDKIAAMRQNVKNTGKLWPKRPSMPREFDGSHLSEANSGEVRQSFYERNGRKRGLRQNVTAPAIG